MSEAGDDHHEGRTYDVAVVGAGPAGRAVAARSAAAGLDTALVDPAPNWAWHVTYGAWSDELPSWVGTKVIAAQSDTVAVFTPGRHLIERAYVNLDTRALQQSLDISAVTTFADTATSVSSDNVSLQDGRKVTARTVIDARGLRAPHAPAQSAFGIFVDSEIAASYLGSDNAVLMDWRGVEPGRAPSFLYAIPVADGRVLLEETCLAGAPPVPLAELQDRLRGRLEHVGITGPTVDTAPTERVYFALCGHDSVPPWRSDPLLFGAAGGMIHPATGYSVAASLSAADAVVDAMANERDPKAALWTAQARAVHRLRRRGLSSLLGLAPTEVVRFFDGFFEMSLERQRTYLSSRDDLAGVALSMSRMIGLTDRTLALRIMRGAVISRT
ncbi:lycopene cyclase family protein [Williamsia sp. R60]